MKTKGITSKITAERLARKQASKALRNARQRCTNNKDPSFSNYGALGIEVRFKNISELAASIGLPKPGQSLDRINPNGHYEPGNVRWASAAVQAANKKLSSSNYYVSDAGLIAQAKSAWDEHQDRKRVAVSWQTMRKAYNRGYLSRSEAIALAERLNCPGVLEANFDLNTVPDWANPAPGYIHLPALSAPGARIRLRSQPASASPNEDYLNAHGRLAALETLNPEWNVPASVWQAALEIAENGHGMFLHGKPTEKSLLSGWIEGACLAMASCLPAQAGCSAAFYPMLKAVRELNAIGSAWQWDEICHPLFDADVILIPDFVLDCGVWGDVSSSAWKVGALLNFRAEAGRKSIIGGSSISKVPPNVRDLVFGGFKVVKMPTMGPHDRTPLTFANAFYELPSGTVNLRMLGADYETSHLVETI